MSNNMNSPLSDDAASICSASTMDSSSLTAANMKDKYEKLVQDYLKTKNKLTVVKKAYVELSENVTQKDQNLRKYEQEVESLSFRNQQLSSRVVVLQNELTHGKQSSGADNSALATDKNVIFEELNNKINENATLHKRINELESELGKKDQDYEVLLSQNKLAQGAQDSLKKENSTELIMKNNQIENLQNDKIRLELRLIKLENELKELKQKQSEAQNSSSANNSNNVEAKLNGEIKTFYAELYDTATVKKLINEFLEGLLKVYSCVDDKLNALNSKDKLLNMKILEDNVVQIEESVSRANFANFHEFNKQYLSILDANKSVFKEYLNLNRVESEFFRQQLADGSDRERCLSHNESISSLADEVLTLYENLYFTNTNKKSSSVIDKVFEFTRNDSALKGSAERRNDFIDELNEFLNSLNKINKKMNELLSVLNERTALQHEIGSCIETALITSDECFIFFLNDFNLKLNQICRFLVRYIEAVDTKLKHPQLFERAHKLDSISADHVAVTSAASVPRPEMRDNETQCECALENEEKNEAQQETKSEHSDEIAAGGGGSDDASQSDERNYYEEQISELRYNLFMSESKLACVYQEFHSLGEYLAMQMQKTNETNELYAKMKSDYGELQYELEVTRQRYEDQLRTMSDHIASMNEQFVKQAESMESMQQQPATQSKGLVSKLGRKSK